MPIQSGDIQFYRSQVMDDVVEGGGGPTGVVVASGVSNAIFPDVSESDRAIGNVRMRKLVLGVKTNDVSTLLGSNVIVAQPPADDNVALTIFSTDEMFDRRVDAVSRLEGYLSIGPAYAAYLYGNHISGQDTLLIYQKTDVLPPIGATLVLTKREGYENEAQEYVRVIEAKSELRSFEDSSGNYSRYVVELKLQNPLSQDFGGFAMSRFEYTPEDVALRTKLSDSVVADAARYYGIQPLEEAAVIGDFSIKAASMFTQLVPSAQVEVPIADARTNQLSGPPVAAGGLVVQTIYATFAPTRSLFVGGGIAPGSFSIRNPDNVELTDAGGRLMLGGAQVGTIDYENGVLSLSAEVYGNQNYAYTFTLSYRPAATPVAVNQSQGFSITAENRSASYVRTIEPPPVPGTLSLSYMAQGRWYVLRDDGSGALRGSSSAFGAGMLNPISGTFSVTLGALPDVGSALILAWVEPTAARDAEALKLDNNGRFYWPFNSSGLVSLEAGARAIDPGGLSVTWIDPGYGVQTATDDELGGITGAATGSINYARGSFRLTPNRLPPPGTTMNVAISSRDKITAPVTAPGLNGNFGVTNISPGSVSLAFRAMIAWSYRNTGTSSHHAEDCLITDDGNGQLILNMGDRKIPAGTINYAAGTFLLVYRANLSQEMVDQILAYDTVYFAQPGARMSWQNLSHSG